ncbi:MAG: hypothetical protein N3A69_09390 [Leptospiraceae bacterium]|nr:hypothetical protein [Leptospiraceae bacterium]
MRAKIGLFFFLFGLVLSAICGAIVGNKIFYIATVSLISGLALSVVSLIVYKILEIKVPEFIQLLENFSYSSYSEEDYEEEEEESEASETIDDYTARQTIKEQEQAAFSTSEPKKKEKSSPDVLTIDNITIKNEPKLMAEAIRTMLATDEPTTNSSTASTSNLRK